MQFVNLSPFHSMAFQSLDLAGNECTTVVTKVGYQIVLDPLTGIGQLQLIEAEPLSLVLSDTHWDDNITASLKQESDLAPFKPRCDLLVTGNTYSPEGKPAEQWPIRVRVSQSSDKDAHPATHTLVDKTLYVYSPGVFRHGLLGWKLERDKNSTLVPLRWEYAFGGTSQVPNPKYLQDPTQPEWLLNEACFNNPTGCGWMDKRFPGLARKTGLSAQQGIAAPCFFYRGESLQEPVLHKNPPVTNTRQMVDACTGYGYQPAGLGPVSRSWAPRVALTGTYDKQWEDERWPLAPLDFDEHYWNCAPLDQQFPWPAPDCRIETWFLFPAESTSNGYAQLPLPGHRAFVMARLQNDTPIPLTTHIDTLLLDTEKQQLEVVWRCRIKNSAAIKMLETRFETDPLQPLLKYHSASPHTSSTPTEVA